MVRRGGRLYRSVGDEVQDWIERWCVHTNGEWLGRPFRCLPWQEEELLDIFEVDRSGRRVYTSALLGVPRKNGKTEFAAALANYFAFGDGEPAASVYIAGGSEDQADVCFDACRRMVESGPLAEHVLVPEGTRVSMPAISAREDPYSFIRRLASSADLRLGLNPHAVIMDELQSWTTNRQSELWDVLTTASGARRQPFRLMITTAGADLDRSRCGALYRLGRRIEAGEVEQGAYHFRWFGAPPELDYRDPAAWMAANPSWGAIIQEPYFRGLLDLGIGEATFRRYHLNQWTEATDYFLPPGTWDACAVPGLELEAGLPTWAGWDASTYYDSTAIVAVQDQGERTAVRCWIWERPLDAKGDPVTDWLVPIHECREVLRRLQELGGLRRVAYDPRWITWEAEQLRDDGLPMLPAFQTGVRMASATQALYEAVVRGRLAHSGDPGLARHIRSAVTAYSRAADAMRLVKRDSTVKIDAAIALALALLARSEDLGKPQRPAGLVAYFPPAEDAPEEELDL